MGKLMNMLFVLMAIQITLVIFDNQPPSNSALWSFFSFPADWSQSVLLLFITGTASAVGAGISIGGVIFKNDFLIFSGMVTILIGFGVPIYNLWMVVSRDTTLFGTASSMIATILISPLALFYVWCIVEWWGNRGN